jgi:hypothetical protein
MAAATALAAGCSDSGGVSSLGGDQGSTSKQSAQSVAAEAFYDCLTYSGLPASIVATPDGQPEVVIDAADSRWRTPSGDYGVNMAMSSEDQATWLEETAGQFSLEIDGADKSAEFARCFNESGYTAPSLEPETGNLLEASDAQLLVESSNEWAQCARDNGLSQVTDSRPVAETTDGTLLGIELPASVSLQQLEQVVTVCPVFDAAKQGRIQAELDAGEEPTEAQPLIRIVFPDPEGRDTTPEETAERQPFWDLLYEPEAEYYRDRNPSSPKAP